MLIEDASSGQALIQDLKNDGFYRVEAIKPKGKKDERLQYVSAIVEAGQVYVPTNAPWLEDYFHELMMFPVGRHDDQVDSTSHALANALIFRSPGSAWLEIIEEWQRRKEAEHVPNIRYNCDEMGMQFQLWGGRMAVREPDGSFLVSPEEAQYMPAFCYRVDEVTRDRIPPS